MNVTNFPKLYSPFVRKNKTLETGEKAYVVTPEIQEGYEWVFEEAEKVKAVEKLDGTNMSVYMKNGRPQAIFARAGPHKINRVPMFSKQRQHNEIIKGVLNAYHKGWLETLEDGQHFGELIGPKFGNDDQGNVNPYDLNQHYFYPFKRAINKLEMKSYGKYGTDYESIREWFMEQGLIPLFASRIHGETWEEVLQHAEKPEGVVFYHPETGDMAKLRRDMFPSFKGRRH